MVAGILSRIRDMTLFLNRTDNSYSRLGCDKAPGYATWSEENRSQLIRIPAAWGEYRRLELRSPDPAANPYLAFTLILQAAMEGITETMTPPAPCDEESPAHAEALPRSLEESREAASNSSFILEHVPQRILQAYCQHEEPQFYET
jgi:glutamine synthetase